MAVSWRKKKKNNNNNKNKQTKKKRKTKTKIQQAEPAVQRAKGKELCSNPRSDPGIILMSYYALL